MKITHTKTTLHIEDSYKIKSHSEMLNILHQYHIEHPDCEVFKRDLSSLISEWKAHNRLYSLGLFRSHTKDVDFEYPIERKYEIIWKILGI